VATRRDLLCTPDTATFRPPGENYDDLHPPKLEHFPCWQATRQALIFRPTVHISLYTVTPVAGKRVKYTKRVELQLDFSFEHVLTQKVVFINSNCKM
jgi:hypothetical protein